MTQTPTLYADAALMQPQYEITEEDRARKARIAMAWKAYNGELDKPLIPMENSPDDNVMSNRCQPAVDAGVSFLFGKEVEIAVEEHAPAEAQQLLDKTWGRKERRLPLLQDLAMNGAMAGTAYLRIVPGAKGAYRLVVVDPAIVDVKTSPHDIEEVLLYCLQYSTNEKIDGRPVRVWYREEIMRLDPNADDVTTIYEPTNSGLDEDVTWQIQHWTQISAGNMAPKNNNWVPAGEPIVWPYPFAPIFSCKNLPMPNSFHGKPDITPDLIGMNSALNLVLSCINRVEKIYGGPILYTSGTGEQSIAIQPGQIIQLPLFEQKIESVHIVSDTVNALALAQDLRSDMDELTQTPGVATGRMKDAPRGRLSGIAIELLFMPLMKKNDKKQMLYGELMITVSKALFVLAHLSGDIEVGIAWQSPMPSDDLEKAQAAIAKKELGITNTTALRQIGEDPEEEARLASSPVEQALQGRIISAMPQAIPGTPALPNQPLPAKPLPGAQPEHTQLIGGRQH